MKESNKQLIRDLISEIDRNICRHEDTHRGGFLWTICDACGRKWADDEGGMPEYKEPECVTRAYEILDK